MINTVIGQILGILATMITFISYQVNRKRSLLLLQSAAITCTALSYLFLGATSGFVLNVVCLLRNVVFYFQKSGTKLFYVSTTLLVVAIATLGALSWQGPVSLLIIVALGINTVYLSFGQPQRLRKSILLTSSLIIVYNCFVFSLGGIANETVAIVSAAIGIYRFKKEPL